MCQRIYLVCYFFQQAKKRRVCLKWKQCPSIYPKCQHQTKNPRKNFRNSSFYIHTFYFQFLFHVVTLIFFSLCFLYWAIPFVWSICLCKFNGRYDKITNFSTHNFVSSCCAECKYETAGQRVHEKKIEYILLVRKMISSR